MFRSTLRSIHSLNQAHGSVNKKCLDAPHCRKTKRIPIGALQGFSSHASWETRSRDSSRWMEPVSTSSYSRTALPAPDAFPGLVPLYRQQFLTTQVAPRIQLRQFSSKPPKDNESPGDLRQSQGETESTQTKDTSAPTTTSAETETSSRAPTLNNPAIKELVDSVDTTVKQVVTQVRHIPPIYLVTLLIAVVAATPMAIRHMRSSDTDYDDLDPEDPVADLANFVRTEFLKEGLGDALEGVGTLGGLDSIVAELLKSPLIQDAVNDLVNSILTSPQFKRACSLLLTELWKDLVEDPETLKQIIHLLHNSIQDPSIKAAAVELVTDVFAEQEVLDELVEVFQRLGQAKPVQQATQELLVESAHNALNDPEILDHSMEFATDVVGDDIVQQTAGEALYNTLSYAVRPTLSVFLAVLGTGLLVLSVVAFQHATSPESESLDRALTVLQESGLVQGLLQLILFPWNALVACKDVLVWTLLLPGRLVQGLLDGISSMGNKTANGVVGLVEWMLSLPGTLATAVWSWVHNMWTSGSASLVSVTRSLGETISVYRPSWGELVQDLAAGGAAVVSWGQRGWMAANRWVADRMLGLELQGRASVERGLVVVAEYGARQRTLLEASGKSYLHNLQREWNSANRAVGDAALRMEEYILSLAPQTLLKPFTSRPSVAASVDRGSIAEASNGSRTLQDRAVELVPDSILTLPQRGLEAMERGYRSLDKSAESLGFTIEHFVANTINSWKRRFSESR